MDIRALPIGPKEAFVLTQVDGRTSDRDIAMFTGLALQEVAQMLSNLAALGAIQYGAVGPRSATSMATPSPTSGTSGTHARVSEPPRGKSVPPVLYEPEELAEEVDIAEDRKRTILSTFYGLEKSNHYELLEVPQSADKKAIKSAYFDRVAIFHPDRYFGKNLGSFKPKLERIFQQMTEAHDTLTRSQRRAEYDSYLESQSATRALDPDEATTHAEQVKREIEEEARRFGEANTEPPPPPAPGDAAPSVLDLGPSRTPSPEDRRQHLARKLSSAKHLRPSPSPAPAQAGPSSADGLRLRYEQRVAELRGGRIARFIQQADEALAAGNKVAAANALRVAASLSPEDTALAARLSSVEEEASATLSGKYLEQAEYEERAGAFDKAAEAYERAARGRKSGQLHERAAHCLLEARGDARKAVELAKKAVELAPRHGHLRITLARAYARSHMEASALGELERALAAGAPAELVKDWERRVRRGEV